MGICLSFLVQTEVFAAAPDLVTRSLNYSPATPTAGYNMTFSGTVKNQGTWRAGISNARFCIDNSSCLTSIIGRVGSDQDVPMLNAGATSNIFTSANWIATAGNHTIYWCADTGGIVAEANEDNNCNSLQFIVQKALPGAGSFLISGAYWSFTTKVECVCGWSDVLPLSCGVADCGTNQVDCEDDEKCQIYWCTLPDCDAKVNEGRCLQDDICIVVIEFWREMLPKFE